jgi:nucleolar protein 4
VQKTGDIVEGPSPKKPRQVVYKTPTEQDKEAIRTIVISGLPDDLDSKPLWKKVRKYEGAESFIYPIEGISNQGVLFSQ